MCVLLVCRARKPGVACPTTATSARVAATVLAWQRFPRAASVSEWTVQAASVGHPAMLVQPCMQASQVQLRLISPVPSPPVGTCRYQLARRTAEARPPLQTRLDSKFPY